MKIRLASPISNHSTADGLGFRIVIWNQGCRCQCPGCHNPETWKMTGGVEKDTKELIDFIQENKDTNTGVTLSGGDPFLQPEANIEIANAAHSYGLDVWAYCGLTFEEILQDKNKKALLEKCDVLVDGPFILAQRDISLAFRGSSNQRIINVKESLKNGRVVEYL